MFGRVCIHLRKLLPMVLVHSLAWPQATHHLLSNKVIELKRIKRTLNGMCSNVTPRHNRCYKGVSVTSNKHICQLCMLSCQRPSKATCITEFVLAGLIQANKLRSISSEVCAY